MFDIATIAGAIAAARAHALPGREVAATIDALWGVRRDCCRRYQRSFPMTKKVGGNLVALRHEQHEQQFCQVAFARDALVGLRRHAAKRGTSAERLARDLVERIVADHLVDAVMDDQISVD